MAWLLEETSFVFLVRSCSGRRVSVSKVDVYSYEIVVLKMVTRKGPSRSVHAIDDGREAEHKRLVTWVREKK